MKYVLLSMLILALPLFASAGDRCKCGPVCECQVCTCGPAGQSPATDARDAAEIAKAKARAHALLLMDAAARERAVKAAIGCDCGAANGECLLKIDPARLRWWPVKGNPPTVQHLYEGENLRGRFDLGTGKFQSWDADGKQFRGARQLPPQIAPPAVMPPAVAPPLTGAGAGVIPSGAINWHVGPYSGQASGAAPCVS